MHNVTVSAPGKVIIHGEHAVVYGKKAIAGSLGLRTKLALRHNASAYIVANFPDIGLHISYSCQSLKTGFSAPLCSGTTPTEASEEVLRRLRTFAGIDSDCSDTKQLAIVAFLYVFCCIAPVHGSTLSGVHLTVQSELPTSAGLGSSAAFATCLVTSLLVGYGHVSPAPLTPGAGDGRVELTEKDLDLVNSWAFMIEKIIHGRPSGIDNSVSTHGGALVFKAGNIEPLPAMPQFRILLIDTGVSRSTKALVEGVRRKRVKFAEVIDPVLACMEAITDRCLQTLDAIASAAAGSASLAPGSDDDDAARDDFSTLEDLVEMNQHLLSLLGVGHASLDDICAVLRRHGLRAKLTGAGGDKGESEIKCAVSELTEVGYRCLETSVGGPGVTVHITQPTSESTVSQHSDS